ncbi:hypothetical protein DC094_16795 [Pelagibaculum spongiae]|uniref:Uncharacterized protein n=1 Tax=Pelagibaculum spongiae TaxID=2080658 RepID=A0A2V1GXC7_9GAMM|nr:hypothetical protein DC094_16795 [Pelagibaculum spongiae]
MNIFSRDEIENIFRDNGLVYKNLPPNDYCYNWTNNDKGVEGMTKRFLERIPCKVDGYCFKFLGFDFKYNGYVLCKPQKSNIEYAVGQWIGGIYHPFPEISNDSEEFEADNDLDEQSFREGKAIQKLVNAFERNTQARKECLEKKGCKCTACGFDFEAVYGNLGKGFIHVHHKVPLKDVRQEHFNNPEKDLIPLCPNCHAMIHKTRTAMTVDELIDLIKRSS